ncbi:MAG: DnaD domain protein [Firmicutes bacterium]|nr:DnaD domain protein [Bacillota bacterium]
MGNGDDYMKSAEVINVFKDGNIVIPIYFLKRIKDFKLKIDEFLFLMYLYNLGNKFVFDPSKFSSDLDIELLKVMEYIDTLTNKKLIRVEVLKNDKGLMEEVVILDDFYNKLSLMFMDSANKNSKAENSNIFEIIEKEFGRTLSPIEYEIIKAWLDNNMDEDLIKEAIKEATFNGVSNLRYIDKILYEWGKNGITTVKAVEEKRKQRNKAKEEESNVDLDMVDWNWFDEDE